MRTFFSLAGAKRRRRTFVQRVGMTAYKRGEGREGEKEREPNRAAIIRGDRRTRCSDVTMRYRYATEIRARENNSER